MRIRYTKQAQHDLDSILAFLRERSPSGAANVANRIRETVDYVSRQPRSGRETTRQGMRVFVVSGYPYLIFCRLTQRHISIIHIRHAARRPYASG